MAARRNTAMRRRQPEIERDKLTMYDLIFYNPKANPIMYVLLFHHYKYCLNLNIVISILIL